MRQRATRIVLAAAACMLLAACDEDKTPPSTPPIANKFAPTDQGAATPGGSGAQGAGAMMGGGSAGGMMGSPSGGPHGGAPAKMSLTDALAQAPKLDPSLAPLQKAYETADAAYKKSPKDAVVKKSYVEAAYAYGHAIEYSDKVDQPTVKYRASLLLYRKALTADPKHADSLHEKQQIESIYQSMGMPVPQ